MNNVIGPGAFGNLVISGTGTDGNFILLNLIGIKKTPQKHLKRW